ncbi:hypothetical protein HBI25_165590 [Parastagonospora nodorum]|nr:hypothetical protein HBH52_133230 [Parastagonospora nodorum]KAH4169744.1 hypothetical protein HBH43_110180 [Parastagonospora nodorum]KAH4602400.1 hypothetical protein HBH82_163810 [Parastagonospora nodorum]KAH4681851.1 hypothetical protein HBH78_129810 [Parastagonospora nodorum]KAH4701830.1 hypothetical protein HBH67_134270 [Parastagonospora nodorum]
MCGSVREEAKETRWFWHVFSRSWRASANSETKARSLGHDNTQQRPRLSDSAFSRHFLEQSFHFLSRHVNIRKRRPTIPQRSRNVSHGGFIALCQARPANNSIHHRIII